MAAVAQPALKNEPALFRQLVAVHESGHAIVAKVLGCSVEMVSIIPTERLHGQTHWVPGEGWGAARLGTVAMIVAAAGAVAHRRYGATQEYWDGHSSEDYAVVDAVARKFARSYADVRRVIEMSYAEAARIVAREWKEIQFLARALMQLGEIDAEGFEQLSRRVRVEPLGAVLYARRREPPRDARAPDDDTSWLIGAERLRQIVG
jgi:hypothetical protein